MTFRPLAYWVATAFTAFVFLSGGATDLARPEFLMEGMTKLGYPPYFVLILGAWKILGGIVVLTPRTPRLKEWAYAGMVFDLTVRLRRTPQSGTRRARSLAPLIITGIVMASWALRPDSSSTPQFSISSSGKDLTHQPDGVALCAASCPGLVGGAC